MKKFFAILVVAILATSFAFAGHNDPVTATAQFTVEVITPLTCPPVADITLPDIIAGQTRVFATAVPMVFTFNGQEDYDIVITKLTEPDQTGSVKLQGSFDKAVNDILPLTSGSASVTYTCTGASSASDTDHGTFEFDIEVEAQYSGL